MQEAKLQNPKELAHPKHKRSKSNLIKGAMGDNCEPSPNSVGIKLLMGKAEDIQVRQSPDDKIQIALEQEIHQLKNRLEDQFVTRRVLEKTLGYRSSAIDTTNDSLMPKPTKELIREIAILELEVMHLEKYLLSLYRKAFDQAKSTSSPTGVGDRVEQTFSNLSGFSQESGRLRFSSKKEYTENQSSRRMLPRMSMADSVNEECTVELQDNLTFRGIYRSHSSLPQSSIHSSRMPTIRKQTDWSLRPCHSQPFGSVENGDSGVISLADYLGTTITHHVPETPSKLSEDMVRCISAVYCRLAEPPLWHHGVSSSATSSLSSTSASSPRYLGDMWSPGCKRSGYSLNTWLENPFLVKGLKEFKGPYNTMVQVRLLCQDKTRINDVAELMQNYKSLVQRLEIVDPRSMKKEEKLAFWINIHNALVMHAYLGYGSPLNNTKRASLLNKDIYIIGGRAITADLVQNYILGCRTHRSGQWLRVRMLLSPRMKFKAEDEWRTYAIEHPEPLLHFALCSGSHSDPAVRIYTSKRVIQQLEAAKEEYIRAAISIQKEQKILLPKMIDSFAKEANLSLQGLLDMIQQYLPEALQIVMNRFKQEKTHKIIEWIPYDSTFRYILSRELAIHLIN